MALFPNPAPRLSIVVPCYNEEEVFAFCLRELTSLISSMASDGIIEQSSFILFVDDGSKDDTWREIESACLKYHSVQGVKLSRNKGHQSAMLAGLHTAVRQADAVITIDADLQDDINAIPEMVKRYLSGIDVVYGVRNCRQTDTWFKRNSAQGFYRLMGVMGVKQIFNHADFRLLSRRALDNLLQYGERNAYVRGLVPLVGFPSAEVGYMRGARTAGESKYPLRKMVSLAIDGITSMTITPLRAIFILGLMISIFSVLSIVYALMVKIFGHSVEGWSSIVSAIFFMGGVQMLSVGVVGEYIGKIYIETKKRPVYHVDKHISNENN